jgi:hypothetical protein
MMAAARTAEGTNRAAITLAAKPASFRRVWRRLMPATTRPSLRVNLELLVQQRTNYEVVVKTAKAIG